MKSFSSEAIFAASLFLGFLETDSSFAFWIGFDAGFGLIESIDKRVERLQK
jgi:hypothetical protein